MKLYGVQELSLIDYPGVLSAVVFTGGCNFKCFYCHNHGLVNFKPDPIEIPLFLDFLDTRTDFLNGVVITGGEPTINEGLIDFCKEIKKKNLKIKLDTNGSNPLKILELVCLNLVDYIAMDVKSTLEGYRLILDDDLIFNNVLQSIDIIKKRMERYEFRITCVKPFVEKSKIETIGYMIEGAKKCFLQKFKLPDTGILNYSEYNKYDYVTDSEIEYFKKLLDPFVDHCEIR